MKAEGAQNGPAPTPHLWLPELPRPPQRADPAPGRPCPATGPRGTQAAAGGAAPRSAVALSGLPTPVEAARRGLPAGGTRPAAGQHTTTPPPLTARRREPCPTASPSGVRGSTAPPPPALSRGDRQRPPARRRVVRPSHLPRRRRPGAPQPTVPTRGAAGSPCSASAPSLPHHHPPHSSRRRGGLPPPAQAAAAGTTTTAAQSAPRRRPPTGLPREAEGTLKLLAAVPAGARGGRPRRGREDDGAVGRVGSSEVRCGAGAAAGRSPPSGLPLPARSRRGAARRLLHAGPSVRLPSAAAAFSSRKWRSRAVTARRAPPLTSRSCICMSRAPAAPGAPNHRAHRPRSAAPRRDGTWGRCRHRPRPSPRRARGTGPLRRAGRGRGAVGEGVSRGGAPTGSCSTGRPGFQSAGGG